LNSKEPAGDSCESGNQHSIEIRTVLYNRYGPNSNVEAFVQTTYARNRHQMRLSGIRLV